MSKLKELIQNLCPDGVEYKKLGELLDYEQPTKYIVKRQNIANKKSNRYKKGSEKTQSQVGSGRGIRTHDTRIMIPPLYRLSYPAIKILVSFNIYIHYCQDLFLIQNKFSTIKINLR